VATLLDRPLVSVVIATFQRPQLVVRAVRTALEQTLRTIEVIVVVDGRDRRSLDALIQLRDSRIRIVLPARHLGNADARNTGVEAARARWIAFLDDDDLWAPQKLALQLGTAEHSRYRYPIVTCHMSARDEQGHFVWPRRLPRPNEPLGDYLFCRRSPFTGEGIVQTSTIFTSRDLLGAVPFASGLRRYVDLDWLLRTAARDGVGVEFVPGCQPLSVWSIERRRARISTSAEGVDALEWARARRHLLTPRAYAAFLLSLASRSAAMTGQWRAFMPIVVEAYRSGEPSVIDVVTHMANFLLPERVKGQLAHSFELALRRRRGARDGAIRVACASGRRA
jgi:glycosyltransferase involved in cell wall biosynthesis